MFETAMTVHFSVNDVRAMLRVLLKDESAREALAANGVTPQRIAQILNDRQAIPPTVLRALGLEKQTVYVRTTDPLSGAF